MSEQAKRLAAVLREHLPKDRYDDGVPAGTFCTGCDWQGDYFADGEAGPFDDHLAAAILASDWLAAYVSAERDRAVRDALGQAIDFAHEERRRGITEGRSEETMTLFVHWSATAGWLASRIRAIKQGDDPNLPDAMRSTRGDCHLCNHVVLNRVLQPGDAPCDECGCLAHYPPWDADEHYAFTLRAALPAEPAGEDA